MFLALTEIFKLLFFVLVGIIIGLIFDFFRIIRKCFKTPDIVTYIHDILFLLISALILIFSIFIFNNGELRAYILLGILLGFAIYFFIISKYIIFIFSNIINFLKKIIINPIFQLFKKISKIVNIKFKKILIKCDKFFGNLMDKIKKFSFKKQNKKKNLINIDK